jgi:hypothetical protein
MSHISGITYVVVTRSDVNTDGRTAVNRDAYLVCCVGVDSATDLHKDASLLGSSDLPKQPAGKGSATVSQAAPLPHERNGRLLTGEKLLLQDYLTSRTTVLHEVFRLKKAVREN